MDKASKFKALQGFTLMEFVIVLVLLSIMAVFISILWPGQTINIDAQASLLADDFRYTQVLAMSRGGGYQLVVASTTSYQIADSAGTVVSLPLRKNPIVLGTGITFAPSAVGSLIVFDSKGVPYVSKAIPRTPLTTTFTLVLSGNGQSYTVSMLPITGRVSIQ